MTMPFRRLIFRSFPRFQAFFSVKERSSIFRDEETKYFRGPHHMCKRYTHSKKRLCSLSGNFRPFLLQRQKSLIYAKSKAGKVERAEKKRKEGKGKQKRGKKEEQGKKRKRGKRGKEQNGKDEKSEKKKNGKKQGEQEKTEKGKEETKKAVSSL